MAFKHIYTMEIALVIKCTKTWCGANRTKRAKTLARVDYFSSAKERKVLSWE
jgi:hypothetical protein